MPAGLLVRVTDIDNDLARRQAGYGRGGRMKIEKDAVKIYTGVGGAGPGQPVGIMVRNRDWETGAPRCRRTPRS